MNLRAGLGLNGCRPHFCYECTNKEGCTCGEDPNAGNCIKKGTFLLGQGKEHFDYFGCDCNNGYSFDPASRQCVLPPSPPPSPGPEPWKCDLTDWVGDTNRFYMFATTPYGLTPDDRKRRYVLSTVKYDGDLFPTWIDTNKSESKSNRLALYATLSDASSHTFMTLQAFDSSEKSTINNKYIGCYEGMTGNCKFFIDAPKTGGLFANGFNGYFASHRNHQYYKNFCLVQGPGDEPTPILIVDVSNGDNGFRVLTYPKPEDVANVTLLRVNRVLPS